MFLQVLLVNLPYVCLEIANLYSIYKTVIAF